LPVFAKPGDDSKLPLKLTRSSFQWCPWRPRRPYPGACSLSLDVIFVFHLVALRYVDRGRHARDSLIGLFEGNMSADYAMAIVATHCSSLKVSQQANTISSGTTTRFVKPAQPPQDAIHALVLLRTRQDGNVRHDTTFQAFSFNCQRCHLLGLERGHLCLLPPCHHCCFARFSRPRCLSHKPYHWNPSDRNSYLLMSLAISLRPSAHRHISIPAPLWLVVPTDSQFVKLPDKPSAPMPTGS
jgi:hypothetical protein